MDCKEFSNLLDDLMDGGLSDEAAARMHKHAEECEKCASLFSLRMDCRRLDEEIEAPQAFLSGWRQMIREENDMENTSGKKNRWQKWIAVAAALVFVLGGTLLTRDDLARNASDGNQSNYLYEDSVAEYAYSTNTAARGAVMYTAAPKADSAPAAPMMEMAVAGENGAREEKIIRNASFTVKTLHFEEDVAKLQELTEEMSGRVEYLSTSGDRDNGEMRYGSLTLRIPAQHLDAFLSGAQGIGRLTALHQEEQDVSDSYYDVQARLETQQTKMERLQTLLQSAQDVSDLIEIENSIADTQYLIDSYMARLQSYDSQVDYSTVRVTVREIQVQEAEEVSLGQRMMAGLRQSISAAGAFFRDCAIFLVAASPWLVGTAVVIVVVVLIVKKKKRGGKNK